MSRLKIAAALATLMLFAAGPASAFEAGRAIPAPAMDVAAQDAPSAVAVFAGGCFWGVQGVFQHTEGVINAVSGYAGGDKASADYKKVSSGATPHAEAVEITYDPRKISYGGLLQIYFSVAHNPTQLNRQGPDVGPQYRSAIFPVDAEQAGVARAYIAQLNQAKAYSRPVVTTIETDRAFYPAEAYHQDYMTLHPTQPYIALNDLPKIGELKKFFPAAYREKPVLVKAGS
ncbi:MAG: peptide-methionine (S)-S-oxide reductase MsrA [Ferrovibrio sp.]|uniref:peptide-methionine (S)-S-oxide reductase MsrA n=1 Tax=Ferrovibrio sp. TaxID=1917215 RepID=UPI002607866D|nr:peptide-methionine (S)-S-oxide reductase MsrA [Ferrovibrio sp.]MCW0233409.1 peptide-methionine (S)-S-oxide reductase MsrA [Ferrovibrio sp.]